MAMYRGVLSLAVVVAGGLSAWLWFAGPQPREVDGERESVMSAEQRQYIWDVEHHVLVLSKFWFRDLAEALKNSDRAKLLNMLASDFKGHKPSKPIEERRDLGFGSVLRQKDDSSPPAAMTRESFVDQLLEYRRFFAAPPQVKLNPKTVAPQQRSDLDSTWQGAGVLRLWGEVKPGQPGEVVVQVQFSLPRPQNNHQAGWLQACRVKQVQQASATRFLLRDATRERGIDPAQFHDNWEKKTTIPSTGGVYLCDFDRDGRIDVLITDVERIALYRGLPDGKFRDVTTELGLPDRPPPAATFALAGFVDIDGDGWEDLIVAGRIYRNDAGKGFLDYTAKTNLRIPMDGVGFAFADYDGDGLVDIYVTRPGKTKKGSWLDGKSADPDGNHLWRNRGNWKFEDVTHASNTSGGQRSVFSAVWLDANNDGRPDLYVPNEFGNGVLLLNKGDGTFAEQVLIPGPGDFGTMGITCGDIDNNGDIDIYLGNMYSKTGSRIIGNVKSGTYSEDLMAKMRRFVSGSQLYLNHGNLKFEPVAQPWQMNDVGWAYGPALIDLDNDGFLDLFATSGFISLSRDKPDG